MDKRDFLKEMLGNYNILILFFGFAFASEKNFYERLRDHTARFLLYTIKIFFNLDNIHCESYYQQKCNPYYGWNRSYKTLENLKKN